MVQSLSTTSVNTDTTGWVTICTLDAIAPNTGVNALLGTEQVAIFRIGETDEVYATGNFDPFSQAFVMSRGIVGDRQGVLKVASPIYKQNFNLKTGECMDDATICLPIYPARVVDTQVQVSISCRYDDRMIKPIR
ncbi:nitrite reductase [Leptolyngbya sp. Heron Island J]|uniref:nitrite reductase small subunit NirD n=1 Tax=Leptolyngbya sp. Heron Island J TaxID=1385935 RepID=UPI0003B93FD3|nr:nitrite reductase small subunit NirD [Leptolyngbya sp. Heron Island J]ESA33348.1 nitrite reductase [Leptolyngbya sp. Heron Island J]